MAFNPFSLLFDENEPKILQQLQIPQTSSTPIENSKESLSGRHLLNNTGSPVCSPLSTLDSVLSWRPGLDDIAVARIPLSPRQPDPFDKPNVIVCHDMMGGYNNDRFIQGHESLDDYYFYHWQQISTFIYFSHNFVTIPPPSWTNAAHRHGVLSLGTVITEWQEGAKLCTQLLQDEVTAIIFSQRLIEIAEYYGFDGWLINIENPIHQSLMENLYIMMSVLVTGLHQRVQGSKVIWYDSVTTDGKLKWQNKVNEKNEYFFSICDGIFLNYHWKREYLADSQALVSEGRCKDVYVGIDVFGRGTFGGGQFNCSLAMDVIKDFNLSMAIFAPGWVYENLDKKDFFQNQDKFWSLLSSFDSPFPCVSRLPLATSFSRGCGHKVAIDGKVYHDGPWSNLSAQDLQLSFPECLYKNDPESCIELSSVTVDSSSHAKPYNNGSVLTIEGTIRERHDSNDITKPGIIRLFKCNITVEHDLIISHTHDATYADNVIHCLRLRTNKEDKFMLLRPLELSDALLVQNSTIIDSLQPKDASVLHALFTGDNKTAINSWKTSYFYLKISEVTVIKGISMCVYQMYDDSSKGKRFIIKTGEVKICRNDIFKTQLSNVNNIRVIQATVDSVTLAWDHTPNIEDPVEHFNLYIKVNESFNFVGRSFSSQYHLPLADRNPVRVYIQPVTSNRRKLTVNMTSSIKLTF